MRGSVRHRGDERAGSWEYNVDTGMAQAQRCRECNGRFWVEWRPRASCPKCGGKLVETEERRRAIKGGFALAKEAQAAMAKVMVAVEEKTYVAPAKLSVREYLTKEWLPAIRSTIRPTTYRSYEQHVTFHIVPHIGSLSLEKVSGATLNALYAKLAAEGKRDGKTGLSPRTVHHVHTCLHRAFRDAVRWNRLFRNPVDAADPPKISGPGGREMKTWDATQVRAFLEATRNDRLHPLWRLLALTGMRRGEVLGLKWEDVDFEAGRLSVRRSLIPLGGEVIVSEPKTARGRRSIALDAETVEVLKAQATRQLAEQQQWGEAWTDYGLHLHQRRRHALPSRGRQPLLQTGGQGGQAARDPTPRPTAHPRHPGPAGRHPSQGRLRTAWARHRLNHAGHLFARHPGDAGGGGGAYCGSGVREVVAVQPAGAIVDPASPLLK